MSLLQMSFSGAVMILVIAAIRILLVNRLPKKAFLALWGAVLLRLLFPFSMPSVYSVYSLVMRQAQNAEMAPVINFIPAVPAEPDTVL